MAFLPSVPSSYNKAPIVSLRTFITKIVNRRHVVISFHAEKEIVVSAGSIGTPQLLLLSGVGNTTEQVSCGIEPVVDLPEVGKNLQDHPIVATSWTVNSSHTRDDIWRNSTTFNNLLQQWRENKTGPMASTMTMELGWLRLQADSEILQTFVDPSAGPATPHLELLWQVRIPTSIT